jgi:hypothetical protein
MGIPVNNMFIFCSKTLKIREKARGIAGWWIGEFFDNLKKARAFSSITTQSAGFYLWGGGLCVLYTQK